MFTNYEVDDNDAVVQDDGNTQRQQLLQKNILLCGFGKK